MITFRGRTFEYRETLKDWGARWDNDARCWTIGRLSPAQRATVAGWLGVSISGDDGGPLAVPNPRPRIVISDEDIAALFVRPEPEPRTDWKGATPFYGDDQTYMGRFVEPKPTAFFGFSSLAAMLRYIENIPDEIANDQRDMRQNGRGATSFAFSGTHDLEEAIDIARNGWPEGVEHTEEIINRISVPHAKRRTRTNGVAGGAVNVGRMLSGNPLHMVRRVRLEGKRNTTIFVDFGSASRLSKDTLIIRAIAVAAMVDVTENAGYSCEVVAVNCLRNAHQITVTLKSAGENLNLNDLIFGLGHPSFLRRLSFVVVCSAIETRRNWANQGTVYVPFNDTHQPKSNEFYIPKISSFDENEIKGETIVERALSMLRLIEPDNLPVRISDETDDRT